MKAYFFTKNVKKLKDLKQELYDFVIGKFFPKSASSVLSRIIRESLFSKSKP